MAQVLMVPKQEKQEEDPLVKIARGLQIAQSLYGITSDVFDLDGKRALTQSTIKEKEAQAEKLKAARILEAAQKDPSSKESAMARQGYSQFGLAVAPEDTVESLKQKFGDVAQYSQKRFDRQEEAKNRDPLERKKKEIDVAKAERDLAKEKAPTSEQFKVALFGKRAQQASDEMDSLVSEGVDRAGIGQGAQSMLIGPLSGLRTEGRLRQDQAERNFVNAVLRRESGAAISKDEFASAEAQYFPRTGDTPKVLEQKRKNRDLVIGGLLAEGGPAVDKIPGVTVRSEAQASSKRRQVGKSQPKEASVLPSSSAPYGDTVEQNGHMYKWNPKTKKYE